jgi:adenylyltransferase/sulfurtransferase
VNRNEDCNSHETFDRVVSLDSSVAATSGRQLLDLVRAELGPGAAILFPRTILVSLKCPACGTLEEVFRPVGSLKDDRVLCPACKTGREAETCDSLSGTETFVDRTLSRLGVPPFDIVAAAKGGKLVGYRFAGDAPAVLGPVFAAPATAAAEVA